MDPIVAKVMERLHAQNEDDYNPNRDPASGRFTSGPGGGSKKSGDRSVVGYSDRTDLARIRRSATTSTGGETGGRIGRALGLILAAGGAIALGMAHPRAAGAVTIKSLGTARGLGQLAITGLAGAQIGEVLGAVAGDAAHATAGLLHHKPVANAESRPILDLEPALKAALAGDQEKLIAAYEAFAKKYGGDHEVADRLSQMMDTLHSNYNEHHDDQGRFTDTDGAIKTIAKGLGVAGATVAGAGAGAIAGSHLALSAAMIALGVITATKAGAAGAAMHALNGGGVMGYKELGTVASQMMKNTDMRQTLARVSLGGAALGSFIGGASAASYANYKIQGNTAMPEVTKALTPLMIAIKSGDVTAVNKAASDFKLQYGQDERMLTELSRLVLANVPKDMLPGVP